MKLVRRILLGFVILIGILLLGGFVLYNQLTHGPLPQVDGTLNISGLHSTVEVLRDGWAIPHIYAADSHDLFFAQGYTQAQDRWWQMEFFRHVGSGTIEELVGKTASVIGRDVFIRTVGWRRAAERDWDTISDEAKAELQAFADGINAYIMNRSPQDLALEYTILSLIGNHIEVKPWTPIDTLVWAKVMAWSLGGNQDYEQIRSSLYQAIGQELTDEWAPPYPFGDHPTILQAEDLPLADSSLAAQSSGANMTTASSAPNTVLMAGNTPVDTSFVFGRGGDIGSNDWVIGGNLTKSGKPIVADDPHLSIQMPSIWYEIGLHCQPVSDTCPYDMDGFTFSPNPGIIIGHNERIAWAVTNVGPDTQDLYKLQINPDNPLQYRWNGEWRDMTTVDETINFADGKPPMTIHVRLTHLGPIINDNKLDANNDPLGYNNDDPMALRWTALESGTIIEAVLRLNRAANWHDFRDALSYWDSPSQNFVYGDVDGNIGYQTPGMIPIRAENESGLVPTDCAADDCGWQGFIPYDSLPRIYNPARSYIVTANNAVVTPDFYEQLAQQLGAGRNYTISQEWDWGYRAQRISDLIQQTGPHSVETVQAIQGDDRILSAQDMMPYLGALQFDDSKLAQARDWLLKWDYQAQADSPEAALYMEFWTRLMRDLFDDQLPADVVQAAGSSQEQWAVHQLLDKPDDGWWDDVTTPDVVETRDDILSRAFQEGYADTVAALGSDRGKWQWGALHTTLFVSNPLGLSGVGPIENIFNRGPFATNGSSAAVNNTGWDASSGNFDTLSGPSLRMIVDLGDLSQSVTVHTTGESGHPYSEHYDDMITSWRNIRYHPMLWTRQQVEANLYHRLTLNPGN